MKATPRVALVLGYAGLLPFVLSALLVLFIPAVEQFVSAGLLGYAVAIISFLGGSWWGMALLRRQPRILIASNCIVILAWGGAWLLAEGHALLLMSALLVALLLIENKHPMFNPQPRYYRRLRLVLTSIAVLTLVPTSLMIQG